MFRSGLRRCPWGAQRLSRALNPYSMIPTLTDCVDPDILTSTSRANVIPLIPLPYTEIPSRRPPASERTDPKAEIGTPDPITGRDKKDP